MAAGLSATSSEFLSATRKIERSLQVMSSYLQFVEDTVAYFRENPPHKYSYRGTDLAIHVNASIQHKALQISVHSNAPFGLIRRLIASELNLPINRFRLNCLGKPLPLRVDARRISQTEVVNGSIINVRLVNGQSVLNGQSSFSNRNPHAEEALPGSLLSRQQQCYDVLFELAEMPYTVIRSRARQLLASLPSNPTLLTNYVTCCGMSHDPEQFSDATLRRFQDVCDLGSISSYTLLYHLEVIHRLLAPSYSEQPEFHSQLRANFIQAGGIEFITQVFTGSALFDNDSSTRLQSLCKALTLLHLLITSSGSKAQSVGFNPVVVSSNFYSQPKSVSTTGGVTYSYSSDSDTDDAAFVSHLQSMPMHPLPQATIAPPHGANEAQPSAETSSQELSRSTSELTEAASAERLDSISSQTASFESVQQLVPLLLNLIWASATGRMHASSFFQVGDLVKLPMAPADAQSLQLASEALNLLNFLVNAHPALVQIVFQQEQFGQLLIDVLVSSNENIRREARTCFSSLVRLQGSYSRHADSSSSSPLFVMLRILLKAQLPFWNIGGRGASRKKTGLALQANCLDYFYLLADLLAALSVTDFDSALLPEFHLDEMLDAELRWLAELQPFPESDIVTDTLLTGHAHLLRTLLIFPAVEKSHLGHLSGADLIHLLVEQFLFPESKLISDAAVSGSEMPLLDVLRQANHTNSRSAVFWLLLQLCHNNNENLHLLCELLTNYQLSSDETVGKWEYEAPVNVRQAYGFVGLENGGATCYMNSVIQQLFMHDQLRSSILAVDDESRDETEPTTPAAGPSLDATANTQVTPSRKASMFYNFQCIFGHLLDSKRQFYRPEVGITKFQGFYLSHYVTFRAFGRRSASGVSPLSSMSIRMRSSSSTIWSVMLSKEHRKNSFVLFFKG